MRESPTLFSGPLFSRRSWFGVVLISAVVLLPCSWHERIEAGDLASHTYNAWLAQLINRGEAPDLYIAQQSTNLLFDLALASAGKVLGLRIAERMVISICVLIFFWGAFSFVSRMTNRPPWFLTPALAMIT